MSLVKNVQMKMKEINSIVVLNLLKMLNRRNELEDIEKMYTKIKDSIDANKGINFDGDTNKFSIYIINTKITSVTSKSPLDDFLNKNLSVRKFIVIRQSSKKTIKQIRKDYENAEFFFENEMLEDIPSKVFIPKHEILSEDEKVQLSKKIKLDNLSHIKSTDTMARYYNAKVNDVIKITRPNITSGYSIFYRIVVPGSVDFLF